MENSKIFTKKFEDIFSYPSLISSWLEFRNGKKKKSDVTDFVVNLSKNIFDLRDGILSGKYKHGGYKYFRIYEPKARDIHKATVRDRILHHAVYRSLYPYFERFFIHDSYSCRLDKGTHRALFRFNKFAYQENLNHTQTVWILKGDIKKCFASIDHRILKNILNRHVVCPKLLRVLGEVIDSFSSGRPGIGIPLGNLTSQLFVNIYLNEFDQYVKRELKIKKYIRYADDFVIFSRQKKDLELLIYKLDGFLSEKLNLHLHPDKIFIKTLHSGIDFLGWVHFPKHRLLRQNTKIRMFQNIFPDTNLEVIASYLGLLKYGQTFKIRKLVYGKIDKNLVEYTDGKGF